jgi:hypothetical protein
MAGVGGRCELLRGRRLGKRDDPGEFPNSQCLHTVAQQGLGLVPEKPIPVS